MTPSSLRLLRKRSWRLRLAASTLGLAAAATMSVTVTAAPTATAAPLPQAGATATMDNGGSYTFNPGMDGCGLVRAGAPVSCVATAQYLLRASGMDLAIEGQFGPRTAAAVRQFQTENGLTADGVIGNETKDALLSKYNKMSGNTSETPNNAGSKRPREAVFPAAQHQPGFDKYVVDSLTSSGGVHVEIFDPSNKIKPRVERVGEIVRGVPNNPGGQPAYQCSEVSEIMGGTPARTTVSLDCEPVDTWTFDNGVTMLFKAFIGPNQRQFEVVVPKNDMIGIRRTRALAVMGDSFSSGEGNPNYDLGTNTSSPKNGCHKSHMAWGRQIEIVNSAYYMPDSSYHLACSGATMKDIDNPSAKNLQSNGSSIRSQIDQLNGLNPKPDVIALSIGGNDLHFSHIARDCVGVPSICSRRPIMEYRRLHNGSFREDVEDSLSKIHSASPESRIILVGYPHIMPNPYDTLTPRGTCLLMGRHRVANQVSLRKFVSTIDSELAAASRSFNRDKVVYLSMLDALQGHELCTGKSWVKPITPGSVPPFDSEAVHPLLSGQNAIRDRVSEKLDEQD